MRDWALRRSGNVLLGWLPMLDSSAVFLMLLLASQEPAPARPDRFDRVLPVHIAASDPVLQGHGPSKRVEHVAGFGGSLHMWTHVDHEIDTFLRVEDGNGRLLAEDDDSGGKPAPYLELPVEPDTRLVITVAASDPGNGADTELHLVAAPETETTSAEAEQARLELSEIRKLRGAKDLSAARERMEALVDHLLAVKDGAESDVLMDAVAAAAAECDALDLLRATERTRRFVLSNHVRTLPPDHRDLQGARANLALTIRSLGDLHGARELQETVRSVYERTLTDDHPDLQRARMNLAATLAMSGELEAASALEEKVLEVRTRTLPDDHPELQAARANHALTIRALGDLDGARILQRKVLEVFSLTLPDDHPHLQLARMNLAVTIKELGDLPGARKLEEKVLEVFSRMLPDDHPDLQRARLNLAATLYPLGDIPGARALLEKALEVPSRTMPDDHPDLQLARDGLAIVLRTQGDVAGARTLQEKVLEVRSRTLPENHPDLLKARQSLAITIGELGDLAGARELEENVLEGRSRTLTEEHPDLLAARVNLADTLKLQGDYPGARALEERVLQVRSRTLPADHPDLQLARRNLAVTLVSLGDLAGARALQEKALEVLGRTMPEDHPDLQAIRLNLAETIARLSANAAAPNAGSRQGGSTALEEERRRFGALVEASARGLRRSTRTAILDASSREAEERILSASDDLGRLLSLSSGFGVFARDPEWEREAFLLSESTRCAELASARIARTSSGSPEYSALCARRREAAAKLAGLARTGAGAEAFGSARAQLEEADRELVRRAASLPDRAAKLVDADLGALGRCVRSDEAMIEYRSYPRSAVACGASPAGERTESLCAFVLRRGEASGADAKPGASPDATLARVELGPIAPIERAVERWRDAVGASAGRGFSHATSSAGDVASSGEALRALALDPLRGTLEGAKRILVVPDGVLNTVPLDALPAGGAWLPTGRPGEAFLGEVLRIELRGSLFELLQEDPREVRGGLLALGGIDFSSTADTVGSQAVGASVALRAGANEEGFPFLPGTLEEVRALRGLFVEVFGGSREAVLLEGGAASRDRLFELAPKARYLHIATHGWFAPDSFRSTEDPDPIDAQLGFGARTGLGEQVRGTKPRLLCGLALAGANAPRNALGRVPGWITAEEIAALDLSDCELAVLSACDTNVGLRHAGQGVASLQQALLIAGARSVVSSLWKVPDEATKDLMLDFYRRLWIERKPNSQALWEAKMKLREAGHPVRDWAAWVVTGRSD